MSVARAPARSVRVLVGIPRRRRRERECAAITLLGAPRRRRRGRIARNSVSRHRSSPSVARARHTVVSLLWPPSPYMARAQCAEDANHLSAPRRRRRGHSARQSYSLTSLAFGGEGAARGGGSSPRRVPLPAARAQGAVVALSRRPPPSVTRARSARRSSFLRRPSPSVARAQRSPVVLSSATLAVRGEGTGPRCSCSRGRTSPSTARARHTVVVLSMEFLAVVGQGAGAGEGARRGSSISTRKARSEVRGACGGAASARAEGQTDAWKLNGSARVQGARGGAASARAEGGRGDAGPAVKAGRRH